MQDETIENEEIEHEIIDSDNDGQVESDDNQEAAFKKLDALQKKKMRFTAVY
ncbi:hypothetical protein CV093_12115 [Oceanobacillus sp. 143]|nr:hypothetical protein CV093_12115 [Oceanobacillus sp. 143]